MNIKKVVAFFICLTCTFSVYAQKVIQMEKQNGIYKIPCVVNGAKMKLIFDTGASNVCISLAMAEYLFENDFIKKEDIMGSGSSSVADGRIVNHLEINIKDIEIQGTHLYNVKAVVVEGQNAPLLLGQSAIQKLGPYTINGASLILNSHSEEMSDSELEKINKSIDVAMKNSNYFAAIDGLKKIESSIGLSARGYYDLLFCYNQTMQTDFALETGEICLQHKEEYTDEDLSMIYSEMGGVCKEMNDCQNSIKYYELSLQYEKDNRSLYYSYCSIGHCYNDLGQHNLAENAYQKAANAIMKDCNIDAYDVFLGKITNQKLGNSLLYLTMLRMDYDINKCCFYASLGALCGDETCIKICKDYNWDYKKTMKKLYESTKKDKKPNTINLLF